MTIVLELGVTTQMVGPPLWWGPITFFGVGLSGFEVEPLCEKGPKKMAIITKLLFYTTAHDPWVKGIFLCPKVKESKDTIF